MGAQTLNNIPVCRISCDDWPAVRGIHLMKYDLIFIGHILLINLKSKKLNGHFTGRRKKKNNNKNPTQITLPEI